MGLRVTEHFDLAEKVVGFAGFAHALRVEVVSIFGGPEDSNAIFGQGFDRAVSDARTRAKHQNAEGGDGDEDAAIVVEEFDGFLVAFDDGAFDVEVAEAVAEFGEFVEVLHFSP